MDRMVCAGQSTPPLQTIPINLLIVAGNGIQQLYHAQQRTYNFTLNPFAQLFPTQADEQRRKEQNLNNFNGQTTTRRRRRRQSKGSTLIRSLVVVSSPIIMPKFARTWTGSYGIRFGRNPNHSIRTETMQTTTTTLPISRAQSVHLEINSNNAPVDTRAGHWNNLIQSALNT